MILVLDYGMGNLRSVTKALEHLGARVRIGSSPDDLRTASKIILPGVGAFGDAVAGLRRARLLEPLRDCIREGRLFLGICLGLQLLFESSEESPGETGLGIIADRVRLFRSPGVKIPHMGWNRVSFVKPHALTQGLTEGSHFYFVHSYYAPAGADYAVANSRHGDESFAAMIGGPTYFATQFHPEKSQRAGLQILKNFVGWSR
jgi:glutamine amidotransferase